MSADGRLWFPDTGHEPQLGAEELAALDMIADSVELSRLCQKGVIRPASDADNIWDMKSLSTKFVRTWRLKNLKGQRRASIPEAQPTLRERVQVARW